MALSHGKRNGTPAVRGKLQEHGYNNKRPSFHLKRVSSWRVVSINRPRSEAGSRFGASDVEICWPDRVLWNAHFIFCYVCRRQINLLSLFARERRTSARRSPQNRIISFESEVVTDTAKSSLFDKAHLGVNRQFTFQRSIREGKQTCTPLRTRAPFPDNSLPGS